MTPRTREVFEALVRLYREKGYCPTIRELCDAVGLFSSASVHRHLKALEQEGFIRRAGIRGVEILNRRFIEVSEAEVDFLNRAIDHYHAATWGSWGDAEGEAFYSTTSKLQEAKRHAV